MPRYIDADKADKTLHDLLNTIKQEKENSKTQREWERKSDIAAGVVLAIFAVRDAPTADVEPVKGWISVKDRLPEDSGDYMVLNDGGIEIAPYDKEAAHEGYYPFGYEDKEIDEIGNTLIDWIEISGITHWMPLPEPPKEECGWVDDDSMPNEDMRPDNEVI